MSKTIPIWACVINRALTDLRKNLDERPHYLKPQEDALDSEENGSSKYTLDWDCQLHLPIWVSETEKNNIANRLDTWVEELKSCGANLVPLAQSLRKPLRTLWISQKTVIWLNEVVDIETLEFTPIFLVSASQSVSCTQRMTDAEFSWSYIPGAADDEESWARGLTPPLFWKHVYDLVNGGPADCNRKVADLVERERVHRALRGQDAPQVKVKSAGKLANPVRKLKDSVYSDERCHLTLKKTETQALQDLFSQSMGVNCINPLKRHPPNIIPGLHWIGSTGLAVGGSSCCKFLSSLFSWT